VTYISLLVSFMVHSLFVSLLFTLCLINIIDFDRMTVQGALLELLNTKKNIKCKDWEVGILEVAHKLEHILYVQMYEDFVSLAGLF
jgi:hypothetical protein